MMENTLSSEDDLFPGQILGSRYCIEKKIGAGGMAKVYAASDQKLKIRTAIKVLEKKHYSDKDFVKRFYREAQAAAKLNHQNIARVYDVNEIDGLHCIVMELIEGRTLEEIVEEKEGFFSPEEACRIAREILHGLDYAHKEGTVHRDIKPGNIMLDAKGKIKITDFGIAKLLSQQGMPEQTCITKEGSWLGTPHYMSPEQLRGEVISGKTDVFSTGIVLYQMLTQRLPFGNVIDKNPQNSTDHATVISNILTKGLKRPKLINRKIPQKLEDILLKALEKNPEERYDANSFCQALDSYMQGEAVSVEGSFKRRFELGRREFLIKSGVAALGLAIAIGVPAAFITKHHAYEKSLYSTVDRIQEADIDALNKAGPFLKQLYLKLCERLEWVHDAELGNHVQSEKGHDKPMIYPTGSTNYSGREGEYVYLNGESSLAGFMSPLTYYLIKDIEAQAGDEKNPEKRRALNEKIKQLLDEFFIYATKLYFVENRDKNDGETQTDEESRVINRFYYPANEVLVNLNEDFPGVLAQKKEESSLIISNYAKAVKIALERIIFRTLGSPNEYGISKDNEIALPVCESFYLLDIEKQVLSQYGEYGNRIASTRDVLDLIMKEADMKIDLLRSSGTLKEEVREEVREKIKEEKSNEEERKKVRSGERKEEKSIVSKDYSGFICGLVNRRNLLEDIITEKITEKRRNQRNHDDAFQANIHNLNSSIGNEALSYKRFLFGKKEYYDAVIQQLMGQFIAKNPSMVPRYYFDEPSGTGNPVDMIALLRFWEAIRMYPVTEISNSSMKKDEIELKIIKSLLTERFMSGKNKLPVSLEHPFGFVRETVANIRYEPGIGATNTESDYLLFKNMASIIKEF